MTSIFSNSTSSYHKLFEEAVLPAADAIAWVEAQPWIAYLSLEYYGA